VHELLTAIYVVRGSSERRVDHQVYGERGNVGGADHPPDGKLRAQLGSTLVEPSSE
jgi:hypothetical protein